MFRLVGPEASGSSGSAGSIVPCCRWFSNSHLLSDSSFRGTRINMNDQCLLAVGFTAVIYSDSCALAKEIVSLLINKNLSQNAVFTSHMMMSCVCPQQQLLVPEVAPGSAVNMRSKCKNTYKLTLTKIPSRIWTDWAPDNITTTNRHTFSDHLLIRLLTIMMDRL